MRRILWLPAAALFLLLLGFAVKNSDPVTVRFFLDLHWHVPLVLVMLIFFAAGAMLGITAALGTLLRQRRELGRLRRDSPTVDEVPPAPAQPARPPEIAEEHA